MLNEEKTKKLNDFLGKFIKMQEIGTREIGLVVVENNEDLDPVLEIVKNKGNVAVAKLTKKVLAIDFIKGLKQHLDEGKSVVIELGYYLDPKIYNQFYLISTNNRMEYFSGEDDVVFNLPKGGWILIVIKKEDLNQLNYQDFLNIIGPVFNLD